MKTTVVDYGIGNVHSVVKALRAAGTEVLLTCDPREARAADRLVLPGVGAFADGVKGLKERELWQPVLDFVSTGRPFLGICVGMQLLLDESQEFGLHRGLGIIPGTVAAIPSRDGLKVPHIGWNRIHPTGGGWSGSVLSPLSDGAMVYFVHSFTAVPAREEHRLADAEYGGERISAAVHKDNVWGCQFHPEKSGEAGLAILRQFLAA
jgi:glutamine amidotransferase